MVPWSVRICPARAADLLSVAVKLNCIAFLIAGKDIKLLIYIAVAETEEIKD